MTRISTGNNGLREEHQVSDFALGETPRGHAPQLLQQVHQEILDKGDAPLRQEGATLIHHFPSAVGQWPIL